MLMSNPSQYAPNQISQRRQHQSRPLCEFNIIYIMRTSRRYRTILGNLGEQLSKPIIAVLYRSFLSAALNARSSMTSGVTASSHL